MGSSKETFGENSRNSENVYDRPSLYQLRDKTTPQISSCRHTRSREDPESEVITLDNDEVTVHHSNTPTQKNSNKIIYLNDSDDDYDNKKISERGTINY